MSGVVKPKVGFGLLVRNLIYWLVLVLSSLLMFVVILPAALFPKGANYVGRKWAQLLMWTLKHVVGLNYRLRGAENIPAIPSIICAKHQSGWETLAFQEIFPMQVFVAKRELFRIPIFGWGLKLAQTIGIDRNSKTASQELLKQGLARKKDGYWISIFPEGTRVAPGLRGRYKLGGARMAKMFEMDMLPVALNSGEYWPRNSFFKYPGTVEIVICPPIAHQSGTEVELMVECERRIEQEQTGINGQGPCFRLPHPVSEPQENA